MLEIEIKLAMSGPDEAHSRLSALSARLESPPKFEQNEIFDLPDGSLAREHRLLRLRVVGGTGLLTYKEKVDSPLRAKVRREVQTQVDSPEAMRTILLSNGFVRSWRYEKYRSYYHWTDPASGDALAISLDETPIGVFLELEGSKGAIDAAAARMGYREADYVLADYRALHDAWSESRGLPAGDLVFPPSR